jgi:hypothetical protein
MLEMPSPPLRARNGGETVLGQGDDGPAYREGNSTRSAAPAMIT